MKRRRGVDRMPVSITLRYADARRAETGVRLAQLPPWRWWMAPVCWCAGHRWPDAGPVLFSDGLQFCRRCGEEFDARTSTSAELYSIG